MKRLKRLQKLRCKIQKCKKRRFFDYFEVHVAILLFFLPKVHLSPQTTRLDDEIIRG